MTDDQLSDFRVFLSQWPLFHGGKYPGPTLSDAIKAIENDPRYGPKFDKRTYPMLIANRDPWGRPFVYQLDEGWGSGRIRSLGRNGRDENGGGDDIQKELMSWNGIWERSIRGRRARTRKELTDFVAFVSQWPHYHDGKYPGPTLSDAIKAIENDPLYGPKFEKGTFSMLIANRDPWGCPFVYELDKGRGSGRIRSLGENTWDDSGAQDDIQVELSKGPWDRPIKIPSTHTAPRSGPSTLNGRN